MTYCYSLLQIYTSTEPISVMQLWKYGLCFSKTILCADVRLPQKHYSRFNSLTDTTCTICTFVVCVCERERESNVDKLPDDSKWFLISCSLYSTRPNI